MKHTAIKVFRGLAIAAGASAFLVGGAHAADVDLTTWSAESYPAVAGFDAGVWTVSGGGVTVNQSVNGQPTLFVSDFDVAGLAIEGTVTVNTTSDDDLIGFALGFMPGDADPGDATADYLLVDWKQGTQDFDFGAPSCTVGSTSFVGLAVSRVTGVPTADEFWGHFDEDAVCSPLGDGVAELQRATNLGATGWADGTTYTFKFEFTTTSLKVFVDGVEELSIAGTFNDGSLAFYNFSQADVTYSAFETETLGLLKDLTSGPDADGDDEIDVVVEVGQLETSVYDFTMTYNNPGGPPVLIVDTAPAEWIVTEVGGQFVDVDACGESMTVSNGFGSADVFKNGKLGKKCQSSTKILWTPPDPDGGVINVVMETRQSPGKKNVKFAPTSCGPLFLNSGLAKVFEVDPATGEPLRDPATGELLPPLFTAEPLVLAAVEDVDGDGVIVPDGSGDEDDDGRTDIEEVRDFGSDPCLVSVDLIIDRDGIASEFVGPLSEQQVVHGDLLTTWPTGFGTEGIDGFDNDLSGDWSPGDDIHLEDPAGSCSTAGRNAVFDDNAFSQDCRVRDDDLSLADGQPVNCDFESGTFCGGFLTGPSGNLTFDDSGGTVGFYANTEDIVLDVNKNGIFD